MDLFRSLLTSKKFMAAIIGSLVTIGSKYGLKLDPDVVGEIAGLFGLYIAGQAVADHGKESAKITAVALSASKPVPGATAAVSEMAAEVKQS
jgi:hypothetical protein